MQRGPLIAVVFFVGCAATGPRPSSKTSSVSPLPAPVSSPPRLAAPIGDPPCAQYPSRVGEPFDGRRWGVVDGRPAPAADTAGVVRFATAASATAISPSARYAALVVNHRVEAYDLVSDTRLAWASSLTTDAEDVALSDTTLVVAQDKPRVVRSFELSTGRELLRTRALPDGLHSPRRVSVSRDGRTIALTRVDPLTSERELEIDVFSAGAEARLKLPAGHPPAGWPRANMVTLSSDGGEVVVSTRVATGPGAFRSSLDVYDPTLRKLKTIPVTDSPSDVSIGPGGVPFLAVIERKLGVVRAGRWEALQQQGAYDNKLGTDSRGTTIALADGDRIFSGDWARGNLPNELVATTGGVTSIALGDDGGLAYAFSGGVHVRRNGVVRELGSELWGERQEHVRFAPDGSSFVRIYTRRVSWFGSDGALLGTLVAPAQIEDAFVTTEGLAVTIRDVAGTKMGGEYQFRRVDGRLRADRSWSLPAEMTCSDHGMEAPCPRLAAGVYLENRRGRWQVIGATHSGDIERPAGTWHLADRDLVSLQGNTVTRRDLCSGEERRVVVARAPATKLSIEGSRIFVSHEREERAKVPELSLRDGEEVGASSRQFLLDWQRAVFEPVPEGRYAPVGDARLVMDGSELVVLEGKRERFRLLCGENLSHPAFSPRGDRVVADDGYGDVMLVPLR